MVYACIFSNFPAKNTKNTVCTSYIYGCSQPWVYTCTGLARVEPVRRHKQIISLLYQQKPHAPIARRHKQIINLMCRQKLHAPIATFEGLARTVYIHRICMYIGDFPAKNAVYTPYMYGSGQPYIYRVVAQPTCMYSCTGLARVENLFDATSRA
jgi:hypothetical protein